MKPAAVFLTERFRKAVVDIVVNASEHMKPARAEKLGDLLVDKAMSLMHMPRRGRMVPEICDENMRELIVSKKYRLVYRLNVDASVVEVVFVFHGARQFPFDELLDG